ncbi:uncharacterized protein LOC112092135 [Morus notabilis]|uniref:uncharacterized protein LOC112092135 n=1 Tax=Morus notabilis TaxID=981085 RepID=UPI000CED0D80|nr:uncharacterized protein LOC112092135 [Morus notabilis]
MLGCKAAETPLEPNLKLQLAKEEEMVIREQYQRLVRRLIYLAHTRPDIAFAGHLQIEVYTDADWAGSSTDRRSTSGYCTFVGGNLVTWRNKKQNVVARSSAEAEWIEKMSCSRTL